MLIAGSALKGYAIEASDGGIGTVKTFLFDDQTWKIRWLVIDTGGWLSGRLVLVHPSAVGTPDHENLSLPVALTKQQVEDSPDIAQDRPVTMQMQSNLYGYYGWDPYWEPNFYGAGGFGVGSGANFVPRTPYLQERAGRDGEPALMGSDDGDPHLRDIAEVISYHIHASDGAIGHLENVLLDDGAWAIRYLIVETRNWWPGAHVLIAPAAVQDIAWSDRAVSLTVTREQVKTSPVWDAAAIVDQAYQQHLHRHYGWPGYGW
jgi:hypothetical protein